MAHYSGRFTFAFVEAGSKLHNGCVQGVYLGISYAAFNSSSQISAKETTDVTSTIHL
jgi:hypothetical protein